MESDRKIKVCKKMMGSFMPFAQKRMGFDKTPNVRFLSNPTNASQALGKTAYYDPNNQSVSLYIDNRHPKDIMRSLSHELVHHTQNLRGDLQDTSGLGEQGYAQTDKHLREMEREAYETGNLCFRDWEDGYKKEQGNILMENKILNEGKFAATAAEEAEKINSQAGMEYPTNQEYWENYGIVTGEDMARSVLYGVYSDLFKAINGVRPGGSWRKMSVDELQAEIDQLDRDLDRMVDVNVDGPDPVDKDWEDWWASIDPGNDPDPDPGPVPGGSTSSRFPGTHSSELAYRKGAGPGRRSEKVPRGAGSRRRDKEEIASQLQERIIKKLMSNPKLLKEALSDKQKFAQAVRGRLETEMKKKQQVNEEFVRKVVRRYLAEMGPRYNDPTAYGSEEYEAILDQGPGSVSKEHETCLACAMGDYCPEHDPANMEDDCPDCAMGSCPVHDTLYEVEDLNEGELPPGLKAYMDKKKGKKSDDDKDDDKGEDKKESKKSSGGSKPDYLDLDKDGDKSEPMKDAAKDKKNESKIYIPENRSMYDLHDQRLFENLKKWAVKK